MADVEIKYGGVTKGSMSASGTKTIKTGGKYCEGDITVQYTRPSGGAPVIESKTITSDGTYYAPSGVDGFNPVIVSTGGGGGSSVYYKNTTPSSVVSSTSETDAQSLTITEAGTYDIYAAFCVTGSSTANIKATCKIVNGSGTQLGNSVESTSVSRGSVTSGVVVAENQTIAANTTIKTRLKTSTTSGRSVSVMLIAVKR